MPERHRHESPSSPPAFFGITERINVGAYLLWVAVLAVSLLRAKPAQARPSATSSAIQ